MLTSVRLERGCYSQLHWLVTVVWSECCGSRRTVPTKEEDTLKNGVHPAVLVSFQPSSVGVVGYYQGPMQRSCLLAFCKIF